MDRTRMPKDEKYWRIWAMDNHFEIRDTIDDYGAISTQMYEMGNYFHTEESALSAARKFRAVLKGADVIIMPSEEEKDNHRPEIKVEGMNGVEYCCFLSGFCYCYNWLKSKIVK